MGLSASMWNGVSGLLAHGEKMNVLGNNIANVNTVGFKGSNMYFEDFLCQDIGTTAADISQVGRGVSVAAVYGDFSQGAFETTNEATDLAVSGKGLFGVSPIGEDGLYYTRAGNFRFDSDGYLVDPHGYVLQGWELEDLGGVNAGSITDIRIEKPTADPRHTQNIDVITNLNPDSSEDLDGNTSDPVDKFFALFKNGWDGSQIEEPMPETAYAYQNTIKVYDEKGGAHNMTIYFDQVSNSGSTQQVWEYVVTINPEDDKRTFWDGGAWSDVAGTSAAGLMMMGTLSFNSAGQIEDMSAFSLRSNADATNLKALSNWAPTAFSEDGYPMFAPNFSGASGASFVIDSTGNRTWTSANRDKLISVDFGIRNELNGTGWPVDPVTGPNWAGGINMDRNELPSLSSSYERSTQYTSSYSAPSSTLFQSQDGYTFGFLQNITVNQDGILTGRYSNGVTLELYQVTLYDFRNKVGLRREGGNLFSQTLESGERQYGPANSNGLGTISANSLEQSNVDMAREFVQMITTQRGFSANGKVITTADQMMAEVIMLKR